MYIYIYFYLLHPNYGEDLPMHESHHTTRHGRRFAVLSAIAATMLTVTACSTTTPGSDDGAELTPVNFILDWIPSGQYAPFYTALNEGYYEDAGLDVEIIPGSGTAAVIQALESGQADIGFTDFVAVAQANAQGSSIRQIAAIYQKAPYVIASLKDGADVTEPEDLVGLTIGTSAGSFTPTVIRGYMTQQGLDPESVSFVDLDPSAKNALLLQGQVPSIETFKTSEAALAIAAESEGVETSSFLLADNGLELYANGLVATTDTLDADADTVKAFVEATLKGWQAVAGDAAIGLEAITAVQPELDDALTTEEIRRVLSLAVTPDTKSNGLGTFSQGLLDATYEFIESSTGIENLPALEDLYDDSFLPSEPVIP